MICSQIVDTVARLAQALGGAWASGLNLYATCAVLGLLGRYEFVELGGSLALLESWWAIGPAIAMYLVEFVADKIPWVDSAWDAVHTFVRVPAGALLAAGAFSDSGALAQVAGLIAGGVLAGESHLLKSGTRAAINASPEPVSNWVASILEDLLAVGGIILAALHPAAFLPVLALAVAVSAVALAFCWNGVRALLGRIRGGRSSPTALASIPR